MRIRATVIILWIVVPWLPVVVYDVVTQDSVEGANIGSGFLGLLAVIVSVVGVVVYVGRSGTR